MPPSASPSGLEDESRAHLPPPPSTWLGRLIHGDVAWSAKHQLEVNASITETLREIASDLQTALARQENRLDKIEEQIATLSSTWAQMQQAQRRWESLEAQTERIESKVEHLREGTQSQIESLRQSWNDGTFGSVEAIRVDLQERCQHLLDEQRVCLKQLSLRASEEAVLADRVRRATELRLEELAQKVAQQEASPSV